MLDNIFEVRNTLHSYGVWYCLWFYGISRKSLWTIFCAKQMNRFDYKNYGYVRFERG